MHDDRHAHPRNESTDADVTPRAEAWEAHARWSLALARELHELTQRAGIRQQRLLDALADRFDALGSVSVLHRDARGEPRVALRLACRRGGAGPAESMTPAISAATSAEGNAVALAAARRRAVHVAALGEGRRAAIALQRLPTAREFDAVEIRWLGLVHDGCAWVYDPAAPQAQRRMQDLSPREREALGHLLTGASEKEVAAAINRSRHTVHSYVKRIYRTLGVSSRGELLAIFVDAEGRQHRPIDVEESTPTITTPTITAPAITAPAD